MPCCDLHLATSSGGSSSPQYWLAAKHRKRSSISIDPKELPALFHVDSLFTEVVPRELDIIDPDRAGSVDHHVQLHVVRFLALFEEERGFHSGPFIGAGEGVLQSARKRTLLCRENCTTSQDRPDL